MDTIKKEPRIINLECNCCGGSAPGRQWYNRDDGYGLCVRCGDEQEKKCGVEQVEDWSGKRGYNWDVTFEGRENK